MSKTKNIGISAYPAHEHFWTYQTYLQNRSDKLWPYLSNRSVAAWIEHPSIGLTCFICVYGKVPSIIADCLLIALLDVLGIPPVVIMKGYPSHTVAQMKVEMAGSEFLLIATRRMLELARSSPQPQAPSSKCPPHGSLAAASPPTSPGIGSSAARQTAVA